MNRGMIFAAALSGLIAIGCEEKAPEAPAVEKAVNDAAKTTESAASGAMDKAKEAGANAVDKAKEGTPALTKQVEDLYAKAKAAIDAGKLEDAKPLIDQLKGLADKVPPEWKDKITALVTEYGKKAAAGAIPGLPK